MPPPKYSSAVASPSLSALGLLLSNMKVLKGETVFAMLLGGLTPVKLLAAFSPFLGSRSWQG
jgi:hypothetical protein